MNELFFQLALGIVGAIIFLWTCIHRIILRRQARQQPPIYEVGSPEYNAQIVAIVQELNARLAPQGKRIPEKTAIDIIHLTSSEDDL